MAASQAPEGPVDRVAPSLRPPLRPVMRQSWHHLLFLHWEVPAAPLRAALPPGLELDLHEGRAYVGLIPFTMTGVRPAWAPMPPFLSRFHETNLRTYVLASGRDPGVWFFSLDAANPVAVAAARAWFHLPYHFARMRLAVDPPPSGTIPSTISYTSERLLPGPLPASTSIRCAPTGPPSPAKIGTLEHFLIERYFLYTTWRGRRYRGQVHHAPYPVQSADLLALDESLTTAAGVARPDSAPLAHYAGRVDVDVFPLLRA